MPLILVSMFTLAFYGMIAAGLFGNPGPPNIGFVVFFTGFFVCFAMVGVVLDLRKYHTPASITA